MPPVPEPTEPELRRNARRVALALMVASSLAVLVVLAGIWLLL